MRACAVGRNFQLYNNVNGWSCLILCNTLSSDPHYQLLISKLEKKNLGAAEKDLIIKARFYCLLC